MLTNSVLLNYCVLIMDITVVKQQTCKYDALSCISSADFHTETLSVRKFLMLGLFDNCSLD